MIAALYVMTDGVYFGLPNVDPWDIERDARTYQGPWPVIAHPPCKRWGRYWSGGPSARVRRKLGDDDGCFTAAVAAVRQWGGVLEHPEASHAWRRFGINPPPKAGGWVNADFNGGWTCCVEQGAYGHPARKATWLYVVGVEPEKLPSLKWGPTEGDLKRLDQGFHSKGERRQYRTRKEYIFDRLTRQEKKATPIPFRDLLISIAESVSCPTTRTSGNSGLPSMVNPSTS